MEGVVTERTISYQYCKTSPSQRLVTNTRHMSVTSVDDECRRQVWRVLGWVSHSSLTDTRHTCRRHSTHLSGTDTRHRHRPHLWNKKIIYINNSLPLSLIYITQLLLITVLLYYCALVFSFTHGHRDFHNVQIQSEGITSSSTLSTPLSTTKWLGTRRPGAQRKH